MGCSNESSDAFQPKALRAPEPELPVDSDMEKFHEDVSEDEISAAGFTWTSVDQSHLGSRSDQAVDSSFCTANASINSDRSSGCEVILHVYDLNPITRRTFLPVFQRRESLRFATSSQSIGWETSTASLKGTARPSLLSSAVSWVCRTKFHLR